MHNQPTIQYMQPQFDFKEEEQIRCWHKGHDGYSCFCKDSWRTKWNDEKYFNDAGEELPF